MTLLRGILLLVALAYWAFICVLTHLPPSSIQNMQVSDKVAHLGAFGTLGGLLLVSFWALRPRGRGQAWLVLAIGLTYGAVDEWTQAFVRRTPDRYDWMADAAGLIIAVTLLSLARWLIERHFRRSQARDARPETALTRVG